MSRDMTSTPISGSGRKTKKLGEILVEEGLISADQLERALLEQSRTDQLLGRILIDLKMVRESDLMAALAKQIGFRFVDLTDFQIDGTAAMLIPEQVAESLGHLLAIYATARAAGGDATALASRCPDSCRSPDRRRIPAVAVERRSNDSGAVAGAASSS